MLDALKGALKFDVKPFPERIPAPKPNGFRPGSPRQVLEPHRYGTINCQWGAMALDTHVISQLNKPTSVHFEKPGVFDGLSGGPVKGILTYEYYGCMIDWCREQDHILNLCIHS